MWPNGRQPTRLPRPSDSPGKNIGVGCHFLLQCMKVKSETPLYWLLLSLSPLLFFLLISPQLFLWHWNAVCILMTFKSIFSNHISTPVSRFPSNWLLDSSCSIGGHISSFASLNPPFLLSPEKLHLQNVIYTCPPLSISTTLTYAEARLLLPGPL